MIREKLASSASLLIFYLLVEIMDMKKFFELHSNQSETVFSFFSSYSVVLSFDSFFVQFSCPLTICPKPPPNYVSLAVLSPFPQDSEATRGFS